MSTSKKNVIPDFEKSLAELEKIAARMEYGEQKLEDTLKDFERGMQLSEQCQKALNTAQIKVDKLVKKQSGYELEPMQAADEDVADEN